MSRSLSSHVALPLIAGLSVIAGCAAPSESVREEIARSETTVQQIQQSGVTQETGGLELEQAKDKTAQARRALDKGDEQTALRLAEQARLDAELARAKARSKTAQKSAEEVMSSIETLRQEAGRPAAGSTTPATTSDARTE
jgi:hypothetical protein